MAYLRWYHVICRVDWRGSSSDNGHRFSDRCTIQLAMPAVSGTINLHQRIALPPNAALTVTVSDASVSDAPSRVLAQKVAWTDGKQAPFIFSLPYNPADVQLNARILLSAAVTIDNRVVMATQDIPAVITNGVTRADLLLIPVESVALSTHSQGGLLTHSAHTPLNTEG
ncbi:MULTISPECIES: YbaY family lipoprotein [Symbiopectobacterium]|uniref:YbaY family lipoprotein n=1 Tax=Symbiopectobacterium TaxID=801 RepID=UPI001A20A8F9|nr:MULTISPECIES: YbaY family lipoprotein [Symbiopectobacterium]MBG6247420.1 hypothetical protein [Candidatus Symbiopectobacterium sp. PLON1]MBT9429590.1 YbaY family lipoprotein [Candidatus Symbiopectobacterium endolongispinus]